MKKRINHFVWLVRPENIAGQVRRLEALLESEFEIMSGPGFQAYVNWDARLELLSPTNEDSPGAQHLRGLLEERGEGPFALTIRVADIDTAAEHARSVGFPVGPELTPADPAERLAEIRAFTEKIDDIREIPLGDFLGVGLMLCEIKFADERGSVPAG